MEAEFYLFVFMARVRAGEETVAIISWTLPDNLLDTANLVTKLCGRYY